MAALTVTEMRALESSAMRNGWSEQSLMEIAGRNLAHSIASFFPIVGTAIGYLGKGHNAGDTLIALRFLRDHFGWNVFTRSAYPSSELSPLTLTEWTRSDCSELPPPKKLSDHIGTLPRPLLLLDGLLRIGATGPLREPLASLASEMHRLRQTGGAKVAAVDLPSGVDSDSGEIHPGAVTADITFMIAAAKSGLLTSRATPATGALAIVPVAPLTPTASSRIEMISPDAFDSFRQPRPFDFHKGNAGRVGLLAGSARYSGAAVLAASGALRGGAGLVTLHTSPEAIPSIAAKSPPELMILPCQRPEDLLDTHYDGLVIGCGLHETAPDFEKGIFTLLSKTDIPTVIDAETLNLLARTGKLDLLKDRHVITPHPGEFKRLAPHLSDSSREDAASRFAATHPCTLLLKGSRTLIARSGAPLWCNPTGNPGMASGGQGDLLSGVIAALMAVGDPPWVAACRGAWLCGRAAERALNQPSLSEESLLPSDILAHLGGAFTDWRECRR